VECKHLVAVARVLCDFFAEPLGWYEGLALGFAFEFYLKQDEWSQWIFEDIDFKRVLAKCE